MERPYHLYVVKPEDIGAKERYFFITPRWTLLYTNRKPPARHREVTDLSALPKSAVGWLKETIEEMRAEYLRDHEAELLRRGKAFTERFAEELQAERMKLAEARP